MNFHMTIEGAKEALENEKGQVFTTLLQHGSLSVEYFSPRAIDTQQPHKQDELYIIASGEAIFNRNGEKVNCRKGDMLFVPAGMNHQFENFTDDFATWVIFYGKCGGEAAPPKIPSHYDEPSSSTGKEHSAI